MSFNNDGKLDVDEALRMVDLAASGDPDGDMAMSVQSKGSPVEGESRRAYDDGKKRMDVKGYFFRSWVHTPPGSNKGRVSLTTLSVVRESDAASASLAGLLNKQADDLEVVISVYKASGDDSPEEQPTLEITLKQARLDQHCLLSGGALGRPCEVLSFQYRTLVLASAPQVKSGLRGAVRTCSFGS
ncbi:type VI secretion system tube protein Hcp [Xenophilus sp.]|uniref:type VI secretion system tube protein Hcp n=1 Tax=Xenophilus sp. TaxID=1873499 RepID=UPI0037DD1110